MNRDRDRPLRRRIGEADSADTYTRSSMENQIPADGRQVPVDAPGPAESTAAPAAEGGQRDNTRSMALLNAHEEERLRLAEELHDGPAQALANAIFQTELADRSLRDDPSQARSELSALRQLLERELDALRGYINQLRPALAEPAGLDEALREAAAAISQRTGLSIEVRLESDSAGLEPAARTVVLRVAQEALRNVAKHARASRAWLVTSESASPDGMRLWKLEVGDDGRGFDYDSVAAHPNRRHFGLRFMRERAELLGSHLSIETSPAAGTVVRLSLVTREKRS